MSKLLKKYFFKLVKFLPENIRFFLIRSQIQLPLEIKNDVVFKIADSIEDMESAFALVYKSYVKLGYCSPNDLGLRGTYYHALPSTAILVAKSKIETIGTLSIVRDNSTFSLPIESTFNLGPLRHGGHRLAEITSMVIHSDHRRSQGGQILFPLMKLMYHYCSENFGVNRLVIAISPKDEDFYKSLLLFKRAPQTSIKNYLGAPAIVMYLDLDIAADDFYKIYNDKTATRNLYAFFKEWSSPAIQINSKLLFDIENPLLTKDVYLNFFVKRMHLKHSLLDKLYSTEANDQKTLPERIKIDAPALFSLDPELPPQIIQVKNFSIGGFQTKYLEQLIPGERIHFRIFLKSAYAIPVDAELVWMDQQKGCGWKIIQVTEEWVTMLNQYQLKKEASSTAIQ